MTRTILLTLHRSLGLALAVILFILGLTGSVIVFYSEFDQLLNPDLYRAEQGGGKPLSPAVLVQRVEASDKRADAYHLTLSSVPTKASLVFVRPRRNPKTGDTYALPYDEVFIDPYTGKINGRRLWGECCLQRHRFVPFMYKLHNRLLLPMSIGRPLLGVVALLWLALAVAGGYLTLPRARPFLARWRRAWSLGRGKNARQTGLRLHRGLGLWVWPAIIGLAVTGAILGLKDQMRPTLQAVSPLTTTVWQQYADRADGDAIRPAVSYTAALRTARSQVIRPDGVGVATDIGYSATRGLYRVHFGNPNSFGVGQTTVYVDGLSGRVMGTQAAGQGSAADFVMAATQPLHAGRIAGWPGRIAVFVTGLVVALLSVTGVVMWVLRRRQGPSARRPTA